jgi:hypothetical protein
MTCRRRFIALLFSIATFSQLSPTIAINQECSDKSVGLPPAGGLDLDEFATIIASKCNGISDCTVDLESWSTNGDPNFASTCVSAGGEVYDFDGVLTCPSIDSDGVTKFILNNMKPCYAKVCTVSDAKADFEAGFTASDSSCAFQGIITSGSMMVGISSSTTLFAAASAALLALVGIF